MPTAFDKAFRRVKELVTDFKANETYHLSSQYSEAAVRKDYIDEFFIALGWDVNHKTQRNPYEQEVKIERNESGSSRKADYAFFLAPNFRKVQFFVEAKRPENNFSPDDYFQTIRYGWGNTPISALTNFQQFHVLDCRFEPHILDCQNRVLKRFELDDYTNEDKFAQIYWLFSREAVADNSIVKRAVEMPRPTSTIFRRELYKTADQPPDESFLIELDGYRERLAKAFKEKTPKLTGEQLTEIVQRVIDRLVFIRFLEDKQIEPEFHLQRFVSGGSAWEKFISTSANLNRKYNGAVFKPHEIDSPGFQIDETPFRNICEELADETTKYNFAYIPIHILGSIYERFLGKIITDGARVVEKPEVRKAGGVYYTPEYIVRYIVENTVGKAIEGKTPEEISQMTFADIACGSGSFLIEVFETLLRYHAKFYNANPAKAKKGDCVKRNDGLHLSLKKKQEILRNNVFGVDIDRQAVEVAQLSLYLKLLEDETIGSAAEFQNEFHYTLLPPLTENIVCGNSLIDWDISDEGKLSEEEIKKLNPMDYAQRFPKIFKRKTSGGELREAAPGEMGHNVPGGMPLHGSYGKVSYKKSKKEKSLALPEIEYEGGFDAIIGNPPYIFTRNEGIDPKQKAYFYNHYKFQSSQLNTFGLFLEQSHRLLKRNGELGFITPNNWLTIDTFSEMRQFLIQSTGKLKIVNILGRVFGAADVDTAIVLFAKSKPTMLGIAEMENEKIIFSKDIGISEISPPSFIIQIGLFKDLQSQQLSEKIKLKSKPLAEFATVSTGLKVYQTGKGKPPQTDKEKTGRVFHSLKPKGTNAGRYLEGVDVSRYCLSWSGEYLNYGNWIAEPRKSVPYKGERLLVRQIPSKPPYLVHAVFTNDFFYNDINSMVVFLPSGKTHLKYLLGIINSKLISFWFAKTFDKLQRKIFPQFKVKELAQFPIRAIDFSDKADKSRHDKLVSLVEKMLEAKKQLSAALMDSDKDFYKNKCDALDRQIDALVYELYGLTPEEIKIIEAKS
jgi:adenine-specific DNA-methyltransferase